MQSSWVSTPAHLCEAVALAPLVALAARQLPQHVTVKLPAHTSRPISIWHTKPSQLCLCPPQVSVPTHPSAVLPLVVLTGEGVGSGSLSRGSTTISLPRLRSTTTLLRPTLRHTHRDNTDVKPCTSHPSWCRLARVEAQCLSCLGYAMRLCLCVCVSYLGDRKEGAVVLPLSHRHTQPATIAQSTQSQAFITMKNDRRVSPYTAT
jgi:hypothetical protein